MLRGTELFTTERVSPFSYGTCLTDMFDVGDHRLETLVFCAARFKTLRGAFLDAKTRFVFMAPSFSQLNQYIIPCHKAVTQLWYH